MKTEHQQETGLRLEEADERFRLKIAPPSLVEIRRTRLISDFYPRFAMDHPSELSL